jgi:hypothetical protein
MGSVGFLLIFAAVNGANARLARKTRSRRWLSLVGVGLCLGALGCLFWQSAQRSPHHLWIPFAMIGVSIAIEAAYRWATGRRIRLPKI